MAAMVESGSLPPERALVEVGAALEYALKHPTITERGELLFRAPRIGDRDPISRYGPCPSPRRGYWTLPDLAKLAVLVQKLARALGGGRAGRRPAPRRRQ